MANTWDANIKLLYATDDQEFYAADTVDHGKAFDIIANVEVGATLRGFVDRHDLFVVVRNLSRSTVFPKIVWGEVLDPTIPGPLNQEVRVEVAAGWDVEGDEGDVLEVVAGYKVTAGAHTDVSSARSQTFIVTA